MSKADDERRREEAIRDAQDKVIASMEAAKKEIDRIVEENAKRGKQ